MGKRNKKQDEYDCPGHPIERMAGALFLSKISDHLLIKLISMPGRAYKENQSDKK